MKTLLCIFAYRLAFVLDMDEILRDEDHGGATSPSPVPSPSMRILDFVANGLPLGMGLLKSGNFLYMFGGEYYDYRNYTTDIHWTHRMEELDPHKRLGYHPKVDGAGLPEKDPPCPVYRLDLTDDRSEPVKLQPMLGPKLYAAVEEIGGLIYILSTKYVSRSRPLFEVWDPETEKSRALPNPPSFSKSPDVINCRAFGRDIICQMLNGDINRFNTATETWECVEDLPPRESMAMSGRFDVQNKNVCITSGNDERLLAIMDGPHGKDGRPVELMFDSSEYLPKIPGFRPLSYVSLVDTSEQGEYMCGLVPYQSDNVYGFALYVFVFQLEKRGSRLAVRYLKRQLYDVTHIRCRYEEVEWFDIFNAVIGRVLLNDSAGMDKKLPGRSERKRKRREGKGKRKIQKPSSKRPVVISYLTDKIKERSMEKPIIISYSMDKIQNPNPSCGPTRKMKTVLCIFVYHLVFILDMDEILRDEDHGGASSPSPALLPSMRILDFVAHGLPLGMGLLKLGNFLYMFGGEYYDYHNYEIDIDWTCRMKELCPHRCLGYHSKVPRVDGAGLPEKDPPCPVYRLDLTDDRSEPVKLQPMLGPKLYAVVKEIGGLIYILSTKYVSCSRPLFEVWDPKTEKSRALPNPPSFSKSPDVINCRAFGRDIICQMLNGDINRFNTASETWECVEDLPPRESMAMSGRFDVQNKNVCITSGNDERLLAIMDGPHEKDGRPVELMFDSSEYLPEIPGFRPLSYVSLVDTSEQGEYMCGLVPYQSDNVYGFALYVFVFQLEKRGSRLAVRYLKRQLYDITDAEGRYDEVTLLNICDAVIGRVLLNDSAGMDQKLLLWIEEAANALMMSEEALRINTSC